MKTRQRFAFVFALASCGLVPNAASAQQLPGSTRPPGFSKLVFSDEFNGAAVDESKWLVRRRSNGGDREARFSANAARVSNGTLKLQVSTRNGEHRIGWIETREHLDRKYGYIEARIRFNSRRGTWGAFWLQSRENNWKNPADGSPNDKRSLSGEDFLRKYGAEIDIVEALRVHRPKGNDWANTCASPKIGHIHSGENQNDFLDYSSILVFNLHWRSDGERQSCGFKRRLSPQQGSLQHQWHVYGLEWSEFHYSLFLDGQLINQTTRGVSQHEVYLLLTTQVDGGSFAGEIPGRGYGSTPRTRTEVDWVRWWQK